MVIEIFNTWQEGWNEIPPMKLDDVINLGFSKNWNYYVWFRSQHNTAIIRVTREETEPVEEFEEVFYPKQGGIVARDGSSGVTVRTRKKRRVEAHKG